MVIVTVAPTRVSSSWGDWLSLATLASIPMLMFNIWWPVSNVLFAWLGVMLFLGWIVYDLNVLCTQATVDDAVVMALHLYLDVINLFMCLLQLTTGSGQD